MFANVPKMRLFFYMMIAGLLPVIFALFHVFSSQKQVTILRSAVQEIHQMAVIQEKKQAVNTAVRNHFRDADHFYIDKHLETLIFLEPEIESLQKIQSNTHFADDEAVKKRLEFLTGQGNNMVFSEGMVQSTPLLREVVETLVHPVEINESDLQNILARIDGIRIGSFSAAPNRPQLIVTDFKLDRKAVGDKNEVFMLNLKLLKREFL